MILRNGHMRRCLVSNDPNMRTTLIPSLWGILVYNDMTSIVAMMVLGGIGVSTLKMACKICIFDVGWK